MAVGPLRERLDLLSEAWSSDVPLKNLWAIDIYGVDEFNINYINNRAEKRTNREWVTSPASTLESFTSRTAGFLLAQNITFPQDSFAVGSIGGGNGGLLPGYYGDLRTGYGGSNSITITFLETNIDIIDFFIRPWIIAASHKGLIDDGNADSNIKCKIDAYLFSRDSYSSFTSASLNTRSLKLRKHLTFENAVPFQVEGDTLNYENFEYNNLIKRVNFAYTRYYTNALNRRRPF